MLIEERFGVLLPWKDYFKRLKKKFKKGRRGTRESRSSIEWVNLKFSRNSRSFFRSKHFFAIEQQLSFFPRKLPSLSPPSHDYSSVKIEHRQVGKQEEKKNKKGRKNN